MHIILTGDKTKVKARITYKQKWDTLASFCGPSSDHVCISIYKPVVGMECHGTIEFLKASVTIKLMDLLK